MERSDAQHEGIAGTEHFGDLARRASIRPTVNTCQLKPDSPLPLLIEAASQKTNLNSWARANHKLVERRLLKHGGILFRGFDISVADFADLIESLFGALLDYSYRSTPRTLVSGKIYTSTEYPAHQSIPLHNENAYARDWPMKIGFLSLQCADSGGETPIADSRRVYQHIPPEIRERFTRRGLMYVRNYGSGFDLSWQDVFQTTSKSDVENYCRGAGIDFEWLAEDRLRTRQICQAVAKHPRTGEMVWFNQAQLFHVSRLPAEVSDALLSIFDEDELPRNVLYGDGTSIESGDLDRICEVYEREKIVFRWDEGDVLLLDNMLAAHGRNAFKGQRKVVVGMAEPYGSAIQ